MARFQFTPPSGPTEFSALLFLPPLRRRPPVLHIFFRRGICQRIVEDLRPRPGTFAVDSWRRPIQRAFLHLVPPLPRQRALQPLLAMPPWQVEEKFPQRKLENFDLKARCATKFWYTNRFGTKCQQNTFLVLETAARNIGCRVKTKRAKSDIVIANPCSPNDLNADSLLHKLESSAKNCKITKSEILSIVGDLCRFSKNIFSILKRCSALKHL
jgi:hypothetical protein